MVANQAVEKSSRGKQEEDVSGMPNQPDQNKSESHLTADRVPSEKFGSDIDLKQLSRRYSPGFNLIMTVGGIAIAETIAMVVVYYFRSLPYYQQVALDAAVMTVIIAPFLYFVSSRPLLRHIQKRIQTEGILQARLRLIRFANEHTLDELLQATLDEIETLTGSMVGYFHFLDEDQKTLRLKAWSTNTLQNMCTVSGTDGHYDLDQAGVWTDCVRVHRPVVHNDYASLPHRKGLPAGHAPIVREMAVPILRAGRIVAILGMGNKPRNYSTDDVELVSTLADFAWDVVKHMQTSDEMRASEEKFRTLVDWTYDWEIWLDPSGTIVYNSPSCERITGYKPGEFITNPDLMIRIIHPEDRPLYEEHQQLLHDEIADVAKMEYRVIANNGMEHWIEHVCRPVHGSDNRFLGRRISNRDITERKRAESDILESNRKERLLSQTLHTMQLDIARDLHDTIGQNISFLRMKLEYLAGNRALKKSDMQAELQTMTQAANESYDLIRGTLAVLQSGDSSDLSRIFSRYAEQIEERSPVQVEFSHQGDPRPLSPKRMRQLFYIFREALTNIEKHAQAPHVWISISWDAGCLCLTVRDNGKGFDPFNPHYGGHYGLKFMKERAELLNGSLTIQSAVGSGTKLEVRVPYE